MRVAESINFHHFSCIAQQILVSGRVRVLVRKAHSRQQEKDGDSHGAYHIQRWAPTFAYLDAMLFDTPIFDEGTRDDLRRNISSFDIRDRDERTTKFRDYLDQSWQEFKRCPIYFDWPTTAYSDTGSFDSVKRFLENH
ncbi:MAG: hypothetical protein ACAH06_04320 [Methylophilaceae bacterium]|jgi:hypothetical protein